MEQSLYPAPKGLDSLPDMPDSDEPAIEIEIEDPEDVTVGIDGIEIDLMPDDTESAPEFTSNLAEYMDEGDLGAVASDIIGLVEADIQSRKDWIDMFVKGIEVLGMKYEERNEPWTGACGVYSPLLTEAAVRFQSETIIETFPAQGPVKTKIVGASDRAKEDAADRVREDMNYRLTEEMPEYRAEHERMLFNLGLAGTAFKKVYMDSALGRQTAVFCPAEEVIIPYGAANVRVAERATHIMRKTQNDVRKLQVSGFYRDVDIGEPRHIHTDVEKRKAEDQGYSLTDDDRHMIYEVQIDYDMPGYEDEDGIALPYVVSIDAGSSTILSIYRNWKEGDEYRIKRQHFVQYDYIPSGFGAYGLGYIHLIGGYARAGTSLIRQLIDAGTLSNLPGGMKSRGLRIKGDDTPISPGEWRDVDLPSGTIKDNILPLPYKEPSQVLAALLDRITEEGRRLGSVADMKISDMSANSPVGTTLALLERQLKTMSAVQARVHYAMREEFKLLKELIQERAPAEYDYVPNLAPRTAMREDYALVEVIPVSDPNSATMAQRIMQYQAVIQLSQTAPQIYDLPQLHRQMIEVLGIKNADKLVPVTDDMRPRDPLSENMAFLNGKPTKAFIYQDHDAHIAVHNSMTQDPLLMAQIGQNPQAQKIMAEVQAHIAEHLAYAYRKKVEEQLGVPMPNPDEDLPEDVEVQLSRLVAQAAQQVTAQSKQQQMAQQAQQQTQDPMFQLQQAELQVKQAEIERKKAKDLADATIKAKQLKLQERKQMADEELREQANVVNAYKVGVMGRAQDASILQEDRNMALRVAETIATQNAQNQFGNSGNTGGLTDGQ